MSSNLRVQVQGDTAVDREFRRLTERSGDLRPVLDSIGDFVAQVNRRSFETETNAATGQRWAPLSRPYRKWKAARYPGRKILELSGRYRDEMTTRPFGYERMSEHELQVGSALDYSDYLQQGTPKMPARPVAVSAADRATMQKMTQRYLVTGRV